MDSDESLAVDWQPTEPTPPQLRLLNTECDIFEALDLLRRLPNEYFDSEPKWHNLARCLHNIDPVSLLAPFRQLSQRSKKYRPGDCEALWQRFDKSPAFDNPLGIGSLRAWAGVTEAKTFEVYTLEHLLAGDFRVTYLIDGILVAGQPCICAGPQKSLKTTILLYFAICLSTGTPCFGYACKQASVLFMSGESGLTTLQETARRQFATMGLQHCDNFHLSPNLPRFNESLDALEDLLANLRIEVLFIDPAYLAMDGADANNMFQMGQQLRPVAEMCTRLGVTLVLAHHSTKAAGSEHRPLELSDIAWSGFGEFARQWLLLSRRESYVDGTGEHALYLRAGGSAGHSCLLNLDVSEGVQPNRHWDVAVRSHAELKGEKSEQQYRTDLLAVRTVMQGKVLGKTAIRDATGINSKRWPDTFQRMLTEGVLTSTNEKQPRYKLGETL